MGTTGIAWLGRHCLACAVLLAGVTQYALAADVIRMGVPTAPKTLDPRLASDAVSSRLCRLLYMRLTELDENYMPRQALAGWEQLRTTHYRFHLGSEGREFHDGSRLDAEDVAATYEWILDKSNPSPFRGSLRMIESIEVVDQDTVDFILQAEDKLFPGRLAVGIMPEAVIRDTGEAGTGHEQVVGSGPFAFVASNPDGGVVLRRTRDALEVIIMPIQEPVTRILKVARREIGPGTR